MTQFLPPNLLALFAPREPAPFFLPLDRLPWEKKPWPYAGISQYLNLFEDPIDTPPPTRAETKDERVSRKQLEREDRHKEELKNKLDSWDPSTDPKIEGDPFKTVFVGRINFDTSESKLRRELEVYGPIKRITLVQNQTKPRGYGFVEYEKERDMHSAYKYADGKKIDGRRLVVDVERGRTVKSWRPRRLGGGLGGTRRGSAAENIKYSGRVDERDIGGSGERDQDKDRDRDRNRDRDRERDLRDRERGSNRRRSRSRSHDRDRDRKRSRDGDRGGRDRTRDKDRDHEKDRSRDKERDHDRDRDHGRDKDRDHSRKSSSSRKDKDKRHKDRDHDRKRGRGDREESANEEKRRKMDPEGNEDHVTTSRPQEVESNGQED